MTLPNLSTKTNPIFDVHHFGAKGDGQTVETKALQAAIEACHGRGGGTVWLPAGHYITGSLFLHNHVTLYLDSGAVLQGSPSLDDYPVIQGRWEGSERPVYAPLICGQGLQNVTIAGRGTIDGQGNFWWEPFRQKKLAYPRPRLIGLTDCSNVLIEGLTLTNSPSWTVNPVHCTNVTVRGLTIINPPDSPNTDGINPDSCSFVRISDCYVNVGDDCITIKAGTEHEAPERRAPCQNIAITNCTLAHGHGGVVIGSETNGGVRNVVISNCVFVGTDRGIRLKSRRGRGGVVEDIRITNLIMTDVLCPFTMNLYYGPGAWGDKTVSDKNARPLSDGTPRFRRVHLSHITARQVHYAAAFLYGLAEAPLEDVTLSEVSIALAENAQAGYPDMADNLELMQRAGLFACNIRRLKLHNVEISGQQGPAFRIVQASDLTLAGCANPTPDAAHGVIALQEVNGAFITGCQSAAGTDTFLQLEGDNNHQIVLEQNALQRARQAVRGCQDVPPPILSAPPDQA